jgi:hypothetical protein
LCSFDVKRDRAARFGQSRAALRGIWKETEMAKRKAERPVLVTTSYRGVFFGYAADTGGGTIKLRACRNCLYWPAAQKGFLGLAATGPLDGARVGPPADVELRGVTSVAEVTPEAVRRWESAPWA